MKQHITISDLKQLSDRGKERLREWFTSKDGVTGIAMYIGESKRLVLKKRSLYPLSIGQMIEFLDEHSDTIFQFSGCEKKNEVVGEFWCVSHGEKLIEEDELVDALWSAVKEVLDS